MRYDCEPRLGNQVPIQTGLYTGGLARVARQRHELITDCSDRKFRVRNQRENAGWRLLTADEIYYNHDWHQAGL